MKKMLFLWLLLQPCFMLAWQGDVSYFDFSDGVCLLKAPAVADTAYLATPLRAAVNARWEVSVALQYAPTSSNYARVYVMADTACLTASLNGYYVQVGGAKKTVSLYRQTGSKHVLLQTAPENVLSMAPVVVRLQVVRTQDFEWQVQYALDNGLWLHMPPVVDNAFTQNNAWGFWCKYTKTRNEAFAFSDFSAKGDTCVAPISAPVDSLYLTEILYDPFPDGVDFVELYNASAQEIDLSLCTLSNGKKEVELPRYRLPAGSYVALTSSDSILKQQFPDACFEQFLTVPVLPNFVNDSGVVALYNNGQMLDSLFYTDKMHHSQIHNTEGFSLERVAYNKENWFSASSDVLATPGCENSQASILPPDDAMPASEEPFWLSDSWFDPRQQYLQVYHRLSQGAIANAVVYNLLGVPVYRLYNNALLSTEGSTYWDGLDNAGTPCSMGIYLIVIKWQTLSGEINTIKLPVALGE
jgi:hypothetical protein